MKQLKCHILYACLFGGRKRDSDMWKYFDYDYLTDNNCITSAGALVHSHVLVFCFLIYKMRKQKHVKALKFIE